MGFEGAGAQPPYERDEATGVTAVTAAPPRWLWPLGLPLLLLALALWLHRQPPTVGLFLALNHAAAHAPDAWWANLTNLGQTGILFALLSPLLWVRPQWVLAALAATPVGALYSYGAKALFDAPRPAALIDAAQIHLIGPVLTSHSFPSGHAITAFTAAAALLGAAQAGRRTTWAVLLLASAVAFSRVAVGAHWPVDVLAGAAGGWLAGCCGAATAARYPQLAQSPRLRATLAAAVALVGLSLWTLNTGYPLGQPVQNLAIATALVASVGQLLVFMPNQGR